MPLCGWPTATWWFSNPMFAIYSRHFACIRIQDFKCWCFTRVKKCRPAPEIILQPQMLLFGKALRAASDHPLNQSTFIKGTTEPATNRYVRRVGRPRREWVPGIRSRCYQMIGGDQELSRLVQDPFIWQQTVKHLWSVHAPPGVWPWVSEWVSIMFDTLFVLQSENYP